ncbi:MAG TPA: DUF2155 domain-containing protein [Caulobacteraceae bacterium]|nr:DUF2155 domain-containing protein [Caulobacteraceae bacterium]
MRVSRTLAVVAAVALGAGLIGAAAAEESQPTGAAASASPAGASEEAPPPSGLPAVVLPPPSSAEPSEASDVEPDVSASPQSSAKPPPAMKRPRYQAAVIQALDKVTAETLRFEAPINRPIRYKNLIFVVRACETTAPDEGFTDAASYVEIDSQPLPPDRPPPAPRQVFRGWMFANAPGVDPFEHPVYDAWLIACKTDAPGA